MMWPMERRPEDVLAICEQVLAELDEDSSPDGRVRHANALMAKAITLAGLGRHAAEVAAYDQIITRYRNDLEPGVREFVARAMLNKGAEIKAPVESLELFSELIARYAQDPTPLVAECVARAFLNSGIVLRDLDRHYDAIAYFDQTITYAHDDPDPDVRECVAQAFVAKLTALERTGRPAEALLVCNRVLTDYSADPDSKMMRQVLRAARAKLGILARLGRSDGEQILARQQLIALDDNDPDPEVREDMVMTMTYQIIVLCELERYDEARAVFARIIDRYGDEATEALAVRDGVKAAREFIRPALEVGD